MNNLSLTPDHVSTLSVAVGLYWTFVMKSRVNSVSVSDITFDDLMANINAVVNSGIGVGLNLTDFTIEETAYLCVSLAYLYDTLEDDCPNKTEVFELFTSILYSSFGIDRGKG